MPWKVASYEENLILQVLQFQQIDVYHNFLVGTGIHHYRRNEYSVEG